jgi:hypothetical protein
MFWSKAVSEARARLQLVSSEERALAELVRKLWLAAQAMAESDFNVPEGQCAMHREAIVHTLLYFGGHIDSQGLSPSLLGALFEKRADIDEVDLLLKGYGSSQRVESARRTHQRCLRYLEADQSLLDAALRSCRILVTALGLCLLAGLGVGLTEVREPVNLAKGKPFTLSSQWTLCHPEDNECGGYRMKLLFHTTEEKRPWFQVDLGQKTKFSSVTIRNRADVARERAIPLIVEVSDDAVNYTQLARREAPFDVWDLPTPNAEARYLKLTVDGVSTLHLENVEVHP